jgi:predicted lipid carrier protein YhbT
MLNPVFQPRLARLVARLPAEPPSHLFAMAANRWLWPALKTLDWKPLVGRCYAIRIKDLGLSLRFRISTRGFAPDSGVSDLTISATARDFLLLMSRREDPDTLFFSRRLVSEGDTELGLIVKNLLDALDPEVVFGRLPAPLARTARRMMTA